MTNRLFYSSIAVSLLIHASLLLYISITHFDDIKKVVHKMEVSYQRIENKRKEKPRIQPAREVEVIKTSQPIKREMKFLPKDLTDKAPAFQEVKDLKKLDSPIRLEQKEMKADIKTMDLKRTISVPMLETQKISNPQYLTYNQRIREKIRQQAYRYVSHPDFSAGDVYLTFSLSRDGNLQQLKVIPEKTHANGYLQGIGIRSIKECNPFPPFPKDLNYPELTFNVVISFEVKK